MDEVLEVGFARHQELFTDTGEHLCPSLTRIGLGNVKGEFLHLGRTDELELHPCFRHWSRSCWRSFGKGNFIHGRHYTTKFGFCQLHCFLDARQYYVLYVMNKFSRSRLTLLTELQELVQKTLQHCEDRRMNRRLRLMRKAMKEWHGELVTEEKLKKQSAEYMEEQRKKTEAFYASDPSNRDQ